MTTRRYDPSKVRVSWTMPEGFTVSMASGHTCWCGPAPEDADDCPLCGDPQDQSTVFEAEDTKPIPLVDEDEPYDDSVDHTRCDECKGSGTDVVSQRKGECPKCDGCGWL